MAAINKGQSPISAISREEGDIILDRVGELKNQVADSVKEQARRLNKTVTEWELTALLVHGYKDFASKVQQEYDSTPYADVARLLIPSYKTFFFSDTGLNREISQIIVRND